MKITLKHYEELGDWYTIVRAEHDGREWFEPFGPNCHRFMMSERLSPEACIEGDSAEMLALAHVIKRRSGGIAFKRCAVSIGDGLAYFHSPKNSDALVPVSIEEADELADQILKVLG